MEKMSLMPKILNLLLVTFIAKHQTIFYMKLVFWVRKISSVELALANSFNKVIGGVNLLDDSNFTTVLKQSFESFCITYDCNQKKIKFVDLLLFIFYLVDFFGQDIKNFSVSHFSFLFENESSDKIQMEKDSSKIEYREESCFG